MATAIIPDEDEEDGDISTAHWDAVAAGKVTILHVFDSLPWFKGAADWTAWRAFLCAIYGLPMSAAELAIFRACTGRQRPPAGKVSEAWVAVGRRGRKSAIGATIAVFEGAYRDHSSYLAPGETARIPIISRDKDDAQQIKDYAAAILSEPSMAHLLGGEIIGETIPLSNRCEIRIKAAGIAAGRSRTVPCAIYDELAFWPNDEDSKVSDDAIIAGVRPAMANVPNAIEVGMSSPYARRGVLYQKYEELWAKDSDRALFWKATTLTMHDTPQIRVFVEGLYSHDPVSADAEAGANFRTDVQAFVTPEVLGAVTDVGVKERPYSAEWLYFAFVDSSGGSSDSFTLALSHWEGRAVLDLIREWPAPFEPEDVILEAVEVLAAYHVKYVKGDRFSGDWIPARFRAHRVGYVQSEKTKAEIYKDFLPMLNSRGCRLLDNLRMRTQLLALDRRTSRGARDIIDHPKGAHDDVANAIAGSLLMSDVVKAKQREKPEEVPEEDRLKWEHRQAMAEHFRRVKQERELEDKRAYEYMERHNERGGDFVIGDGGM